MQRIVGEDLAPVLSYFQAAAAVAIQATCLRAHCGSVIVREGEIIGRGFNGPTHGDEANQMCEANFDYSIKPKYDKTCCVHAEWRAILDACKRNGQKVEGSRLYFMRVDKDGNFTNAGEPYCTVCSRLTLESGISEFALWNIDGADVYSASEYNQVSYASHINR